MLIKLPSLPPRGADNRARVYVRDPMLKSDRQIIHGHDALYADAPATRRTRLSRTGSMK
jgi:hypothetical protein